MTKRLTPDEKARRKFRRSRQGRALATRLTPRTPAETAEFLAMIERQGVEAEARGKRILAAYVQNDRHLQADRDLKANRRGHVDYRSTSHGGNVRHGLAAPVPMPHGTPLASRIAAATAVFQRNLAQAPRDDTVYVRPPRWWIFGKRAARRERRHWWQFWRPRWVRYRLDEE